MGDAPDISAVNAVEMLLRGRPAFLFASEQQVNVNWPAEPVAQHAARTWFTCMLTPSDQANLTRSSSTNGASSIDSLTLPTCMEMLRVLAAAMPRGPRAPAHLHEACEHTASGLHCAAEPICPTAGRGTLRPPHNRRSAARGRASGVAAA